MLKTKTREFASGAEAMAHYVRLGFTRDEETYDSAIVMDDGICVVRIEHKGMLDWVATEITPEV
jgi:hypothetical protein